MSSLAQPRAGLETEGRWHNENPVGCQNQNEPKTFSISVEVTKRTAQVATNSTDISLQVDELKRILGVAQTKRGYHPMGT